MTAGPPFGRRAHPGRSHAVDDDHLAESIGQDAGGEQSAEAAPDDDGRVRCDGEVRVTPRSSSPGGKRRRCSSAIAAQRDERGACLYDLFLIVVACAPIPPASSAHPATSALTHSSPVGVQEDVGRCRCSGPGKPTLRLRPGDPQNKARGAGPAGVLPKGLRPGAMSARRAMAESPLRDRLCAFDPYSARYLACPGRSCC